LREGRKVIKGKKYDESFLEGREKEEKEEWWWKGVEERKNVEENKGKGNDNI
jgi:hypothetical protein